MPRTSNTSETAIPRLVGIRQVSDGWIKKYVLAYAMPDGSTYEYESASRKSIDAYRAELEGNARGEQPIADAVCIVPQAPDGQVAHDTAYVRRQPFRPLGRDGVPRAEVGVVHALGRVTLVGQYVPGQGVEQPAVLGVQFRDSPLRAREEQLQNIRIVHRRTSFPSSPVYYTFAGGYYKRR